MGLVRTVLSNLKRQLLPQRKSPVRGLRCLPRLEPLEMRVLLAGEFTDIGPLGLPDLTASAVAWGDYDSDGDLDVVATGSSKGGLSTASIFRNDGGTFTNINAGLPAVFYGSVAWGDFNNDGKLDLAVSGFGATGPVSKIYRNDGGGTFTDTHAAITNVDSPNSLAWGDADNDGDLDLLLAGRTPGPMGGDVNVAKVYRNDGGTFTDINAALAGVKYGSVAWGDYDTDGDLDILLTGLDNTANRISKVYRNDGGGTFTDINAALTGVQNGTAVWGDYNSDGKLDILLTGKSGPLQINSTTKVYRNDGNGAFTDINAALDPVILSSAAWGDFDNDGDLDIVLAGNNQQYTPIAKVYRNDGSGTFTDLQGGFSAAQDGSVAWGDLEGDGDLDLLKTGTFAPNSFATKFYRNNAAMANTTPAAPTGLTTTINSPTSQTFSWTAATDTKTPSAGLSYNLRVGTTPGGSDVFTTMANTTSGLRRLSAAGPIQGTSLTLTGLKPGTNYFWSVQAVDSSFAGSPFAPEPLNTNAAPVVKPQNFLIGENSVNGAFIGTITATDVDPGQTRTFTITAGNTNDAFAIDPNTGVLTVKTSAALDFEKITQFNLSVTATDNGTPSKAGSAAVTVFLRDENDPPKIIVKDFLIGENSANGAFIGTIKATDQDVGQSHTFSIIAGNQNNAFAIDPNTGVLTVNNTKALNFESVQQFPLTIRVVDNCNPAKAASAVSTVFLRDENDAPVLLAKPFLIGENSTNGAFIGTVKSYDVDAGQTRTYAIVAGNQNNAFAIDPNTGVLTVNNSATLDFESRPQFNLTVKVTDNGTPAKATAGIVTIFLRDENDAPVVIPKSFSIKENTPNGAFIGTVQATDQDPGQTRTFSIVAGNKNNAFAIDPATGVLTVNNSAALDFEKIQQFNLTIRVVDNGNPAKSGAATVTVFLRDVVGARPAAIRAADTTTIVLKSNKLSKTSLWASTAK